MTLMVRDESDIIAPMIDYHLDAGVDVIIITDNGSIDGTRGILAAFEDDPRVVVVDDPAHDKNQSARVTAMARRAYTEYGADWVVNADADEFFVPVDRDMLLRELFEQLPKSLGSAIVPVIDMTGTPARTGAGLRRLRLRDERAESSLFDDAGLYAHATHDAIHVGSPDVTVSQGNHFVTIPSQGALPRGLELESLHFPWRSFEQFQAKVINAGRAYEANGELTPSPRHHGMRDYRFHLAGLLEESYIYRHPLQEGQQSGRGLVEDNWLHERLAHLADEGHAVRPDLLRLALDDSGDKAYSTADRRAAAKMSRAVLSFERERADIATAAQRDRLELRLTHDHVASLEARISGLESELRDTARALASSSQRSQHAELELERVHLSRSYQLARLLSAPVRRLRSTSRRSRAGGA